MANHLHIVLNGDQWAIKEEGVEEPRSLHPTRDEAVEHAQETLGDEGYVYVHGRRGQIENVRPANGRTRGRNGSSSWHDDLQLHDVLPVFSRVSWGAIFAGVVIALTIYLAMGLFGVALGLSIDSEIGAKPLSISAAIWAGLTVIVSLFLGGFVASRSTVGEEPGEGLIYGVLVWGTIFTILSLSASTGLAVGFSALVSQASTPMVAQVDATEVTEFGQTETTTDPESTQDAPQATQETEQNLQEAMRYDAEAAWFAWAFMIFSILAAVAGALTGSGPHPAKALANPNSTATRT